MYIKEEPKNYMDLGSLNIKIKNTLTLDGEDTARQSQQKVLISLFVNFLGSSGHMTM